MHDVLAKGHPDIACILIEGSAQNWRRVCLASLICGAAHVGVLTPHNASLCMQPSMAGYLRHGEVEVLADALAAYGRTDHLLRV